MLTNDQWRDISGILLIFGSLYILQQVYYQLVNGLPTEQRKSACLLVFVTSMTMLQYGLAALFAGPWALATSARGPVVFLLWIASIAWWARATQRHNQEARKRGATYPPIWRKAFWKGVLYRDKLGIWHWFRGSVTLSGDEVIAKREQVVGRREGVATERERVVTEREDRIDQTQ